MAENVTFPLRLQTVTFTKLNFEVMFDFDPEKHPEMEVRPINNVGVQEAPDQRNYLLAQMNTLINPEKTAEEPYHIEAICLAVFEYPPNMPLEEAKRAVLITGHNVCYGAIRETVSWLTGRLPYGPVQLGLSVLNPPPRQNELEPEKIEK
jgi:hypothetical protein